jgi:hypothetical protein
MIREKVKAGETVIAVLRRPNGRKRIIRKTWYQRLRDFWRQIKALDDLPGTFE